MTQDSVHPSPGTSDRSGETDPPTFTTLNRDGRAPLLLLCDHASNSIPHVMSNLGLEQEHLNQHIGWDIGAAYVTHGLSKRLDAAAVVAGYSRLLIDNNRPLGHESSIPEMSDGVAIPGNQNLAEAEREARAEQFFWPYHHEAGQVLAHVWRHGPAPALVSVHSFTPKMGGVQRPWHAGILWNRDPRMALPIMRFLERQPGIVVGDNEPYSGKAVGYTIDTHAAAAGLPHVLIEIRQDLLSDEIGCERWINLIAQSLEPLLEEASMHKVVHF